MQPSFEAGIIEALKQMLEGIKQLHSLNHIHNDIKAENFMCKNNKIYIIDFGVMTEFNEGRSDSYSPFEGSLPYASLRAHKQRTKCFADDLESLGYTILALIVRKYGNFHDLWFSIPDDKKYS